MQDGFLHRLNSPLSKYLPSEAKFTIWQSLFVARAYYGNIQLAKHSHEVAKQLSSTVYQSFRTLFNIRSIPKKQVLCQLIIGISAEDFIRNRLGSDKTSIDKTSKAHDRLKMLIECNASPLILYHLRHFVQPKITNPITGQ